MSSEDFKERRLVVRGCALPPDFFSASKASISIAINIMTFMFKFWCHNALARQPLCSNNNDIQGGGVASHPH